LRCGRPGANIKDQPGGLQPRGSYKKRGEAGLIHWPYRVDGKVTGETDPCDRPPKDRIELFLSSMLHCYNDRKETYSSSRPCDCKITHNAKNKSADPCDRPNLSASYSLSICSIDLMDEGKLGYRFTSADELEEVDIGPGDKSQPTFISKKLKPELRKAMITLLREYTDCFAWDYAKMPGLDRSIVEHRLPLKPGFRPFQQRAR
jgi:hypothetical protein